jgi:hypothetical protein
MTYLGARTNSTQVGFEVFTVVVLKSIFFWDMTPCSALSGTPRFGGTYRLHLQGCRIVQQSSEQASGKQSLPNGRTVYIGNEGRTQFLLVSPGQGETGELNLDGLFQDHTLPSCSPICPMI